MVRYRAGVGDVLHPADGPASFISWIAMGASAFAAMESELVVGIVVDRKIEQ